MSSIEDPQITGKEVDLKTGARIDSMSIVQIRRELATNKNVMDATDADIATASAILDSLTARKALLQARRQALLEGLEAHDQVTNT